jgi:hypothetical protein
MSENTYEVFDPLMTAGEADAMVRLCENFGSYGTYAEEPTFEGIGEGLPARYDAVRNFLRTGGRRGSKEDLRMLASRTNYFRETYAYGNDVRIDGIEPFLHHEGFVEAARALYGRPVIEPAIVFANLMVPGQELAVHSDVPEFRGVNRKQHPQWLIVVMHHSGLFEKWRMPIATGVAWFHDCRGGEFAFYPDGPQAPAVAHPVRFNTAVLLDTDTIFHGVDRVAETGAPVAFLEPGTRLVFEGQGTWRAVLGERTLARYRWQDLRFSISWKAYCFADEAEREAWHRHADDLSVEAVVETLVDDLRRRDRIAAERPSNAELVDVLIDEYVPYPAAAGHASSSAA